MNILSRQPKPKPKSKPKPIRCGFTLVELLFVIAIIAILSTLSLAMIRMSQQEARTSATQSRLTQIENILSIYIEDMEFRKLPFSNLQLENCVMASTVSEKYIKTHQLREQILVDYLNAEMPSTPINNNLGKFPSLAYPNFPLAAALLSDPSKHTAMVQQWGLLSNSNDMGFDRQGQPLPGELLYKLLQMINSEGGNALEALGNGAISNVDGDDYPEVVDAWGDPLQFQLSLRDPVTGDSVPLNSNNVPLELQNLRFEVWSDNLLGERRVEF